MTATRLPIPTLARRPSDVLIKARTTVVDGGILTTTVAGGLA